MRMLFSHQTAFWCAVLHKSERIVLIVQLSNQIFTVKTVDFVLTTVAGFLAVRQMRVIRPSG